MKRGFGRVFVGWGSTARHGKQEIAKPWKGSAVGGLIEYHDFVRPPMFFNNFPHLIFFF